jgi:hypothetical protein
MRFLPTEETAQWLRLFSESVGTGSAKSVSLNTSKHSSCKTKSTKLAALKKAARDLWTLERWKRLSKTIPRYCWKSTSIKNLMEAYSPGTVRSQTVTGKYKPKTCKRRSWLAPSAVLESAFSVMNCGMPYLHARAHLKKRSETPWERPWCGVRFAKPRL